MASRRNSSKALTNISEGIEQQSLQTESLHQGLNLGSAVKYLERPLIETKPDQHPNLSVHRSQSNSHIDLEVFREIVDLDSGAEAFDCSEHIVQDFFEQAQNLLERAKDDL